MSEQLVLACDASGTFTGEYVQRDAAHLGDGRRHLAIAVLLHDEQQRVLLQRRRHQVFDDVWDLTGATHLLHLAHGDETEEQATKRCLDAEYGIRDVPVRCYGAFAYFARDGERCENEYCHLLVGPYSGPVQVNPLAGYGTRWVHKQVLLSEVGEQPERFSPWAVAGIAVLRRGGFFDHGS